MSEQERLPTATFDPGPSTSPYWTRRARRDFVLLIGVATLYAVIAYNVSLHQYLPMLRNLESSHLSDELLIGLVLAGALGTWFGHRRATETRAIVAQWVDADRLNRVSFDESPQPMWISDAQTFRFLAVNDAACDRYGWTRDEFLGGLTVRDLHPPEALAALDQAMQTRPGEHQRFDGMRHRTKRGDMLIVDVVRQPMVYRGRDARLAIPIDMTRHHHLEGARQDTMRRLEAFYQTSAAGIVETDARGTILECNAAYGRLTGWAPTDLVGQNVLDITPVEEVADLRSRIRRLTDGVDQSFSLIKHYARPDGSRPAALVTVSTIRTDAEAAPRILAVAIDVSEQQRLAEERATALAHYDALFNTQAAGITELEAPSRIVDCNETFATLIGRDRADVIGRSLLDLTHDSDRDKTARLLAGTFADGSPGYAIVKRYVRPDGAPVWALATVTPIAPETGKPARAVGLVIDLSARMQAEEERTEAHERLQLALEAIGEGLWDWDVKTDHVFFSPMLSRMLGYEPAEFPSKLSSWADRVHPEDMPKVRAALDAHLRGETALYETEHRLRCKDGRWLWILDRGRVIARDAAGRPTRMIGTHADISSRRELEDQLRQAQKMEAIGQLAGGVAHDFNNLLTVIRTGLELALAENLSEEARADLSEVEMATERASTLTSQLLAFSRRKVAQPRLMSLNDAVTDLTKLVHRVLPEDISVRRRLEGTAKVMADPGHVGQALLNLAVNARDAMPGGGVLTLSTADLTVDEDSVALHDGVAPGRYSVLTVGDSGIGMTEEVRSHIFEPFFTTKAPGKGTGLGLASVYGIVKQVNGFVRVESSPGAGARFILYFPVAASVAEERDDNGRPLLPGGRELVLLVEDEPMVRSVAARLLSTHGYRVREAANGSQALDVLAAEPGISCVITDVVMPVMSGSALLAVMRERHADVATVVMSAHANDVLAQFPLPAGTDVLAKPFSATSLLVAVRSAIDAQAATAK